MSHARIATAIFLIVTALLLAFHGQRMVLTNDEGIVLESAQRMAAGGRIYVDFFGYMSPGSYWLQELVFRLFGFALWTGRLIVILDFSLQCALVYWLVARLVDKSPTAIRRGKYALRAIEAMSFDQAIAYTEGQIALLAMTDDAREGLASFNEKRKPRWTGR